MRCSAVAVATLLLLGLAGCSDENAKETVPAQLLQPSDVAEAAEFEVDSGRSVTRTNCGRLWVEASVARTDKESPFVTYRLDDDNVVISTVMGPSSGRSSVDDSLTEVDSAIDDCASDESDKTVVERIEGLPAAALGFRELRDDTGERQITERAYGRVDDTSLAVVTVVHTGTGEPPVSVTDLLPKALERATRR